MVAENQPTSAQANPLTEASPQSLDELFSRDPLHLNDTDIDVIVTELRRQRAQWLIAEANGAKSAKRTSAPKSAAPSNVSLDDLGL